MISGTVHFWHWLELLYTLDRVGYDGWFGGDINSKHIGPVEAYDTNTRMIRRMIDLLRRMDPEKIASFIKKDGGVAETFNYLTQCLMAKGV